MVFITCMYVISHFFPVVSRVCVAASLPDGVLVRVEAVVWRYEGGEDGEGVEEKRRSSLHVQSHSEWAPANIGPYSQAYTVRAKEWRKRERTQ